MIKKIFLFLLLFMLGNSNIQSQNNSGSVFGIISDFSNNTSLPNVNIYLSKTTIGASSDNHGNYIIKGIPEGKYTIVISMIGYKSISKRIEIIKSKSLNLDVSLKPLSIKLNTVNVIGDKSLYEDYLKELYEYRKIFRKYFLGQTKLSEDCEILNIEKVYFEKSTLGIITASCDEPIQIINNALGYKIDCVLEYFLCNDKRGSVQMIFHPFFMEMGSDDEDQLSDWEEKRENTYLSSLRRFLLSVVNHEIEYRDYGLYLNDNFQHIEKIPKAKIFYGSEKISKIDSITNKMKLKFEGFLLVHNNKTEEYSYINLPFGEANLEEDGYLADPLSMVVDNVFAKHGLANQLPDNEKFEY